MSVKLKAAVSIAAALLAAAYLDWYLSPYQTCLREQTELWERETMPNPQQIARETCRGYRRW